MSLWQKTLLMVSVMALVLVGAAYGGQRFLIMGTFLELEKQNTQRNVERALKVIANEIQHLDIVVSDWAAWDDTYEFVVDGNEDYIQSNFVDETFTGYGINIIIVVDSTAEIIFAKGFDLANEEEMFIPEFSREELYSGHPLLSHTDTESSIAGLILLSDGPMLVASRPILTSDERGPIRGTFLMGRLVDEEVIQQWAEMAQLSLTLQHITDPQLPSDFQLAKSSLSSGESVFVQPLNEVSAAGYALLRDIHGDPALILRSDQPRNIYRYGLASSRYLATAAGLVVLAFGVMSLLLLERVVLSRVSDLARQVRRVGETGDLSARVSLKGRDEITGLADRINDMLSDLQQGWDFLRRRERYMRGLAEAAQALLLPSADTARPAFLQALGQATRASRAYVCLNYRGPGGELLTTQVAQWCAEEIEPQIDNPGLQKFPLATGGFQRWIDTLSRGEAISGLVAEFPPAERAVLETRGIKAILALPLLLDGAFAGFLGFDRCAAAQGWMASEADLLRMAAAGLSQTLKRKRAEEELRQVKEFNEGIVRGVAEALLIENSEGMIAFVNPALEELLSYTADELAGCHWRKIVPEGEIELVQAKTSQRPADVRDQYETRLLSKDGREIPVLVSARALFEEGTFTGVLSAFTDITARKRAEEERRQLEAQLHQAQKMEAVGLLAGGVAHEFNNLLTVMQGNAELGLAQVEPGHTPYKELSAIQRAAKRAAKLTKQLLAFSRRQALQPQVVNLNRLVTDFSETLGRIIVGLDIEVQVKLAPKLGSVLADASTLEQVLTNLALNARDAMPEGGTLSIETAQVTLDDAYCRSHPDARPGDYVRVTVADTGVGMDEATRENLCQPFFSTKAVGKGPGLGLAMVYGIVKQHDGLIEVYSQLGKGTRFVIHLPVHQIDT